MFVHRSHDDICTILERHAHEVLETATTAGGKRSLALVEAGDHDLPGFDRAEPLRLLVDPLVRDHPNHAWIEFSWEANEKKRLLANVNARLDIRPLVKSGRRATTELTLWADHRPVQGTRRSPEAILFSRRVVKAAMHRMLETVAASLEDFEEPIIA